MRSIVACVVVAVSLLPACDPASLTGAWCQYPADCHRPNVCAYHRCRPPCQLDADCTTHRCIPGAPGGCAVEQDHGCAALPERACPSPLVCAADQCSAGCITAASCPADGVCRPSGASMICADPAEPVPDAGAIVDAGVDAGRRDGGV